MTTVDKTREQMIEDCQGLVRSLAWRIHRNLPEYIDIDDLVSYGQVGLAEAARDFDSTRGTQFSTFAYYRIRGSIYDGLANMTCFGRARHSRLRFEPMANELLQLEQEAQGEPRVEDEIRWLKNLSSSLAVVYLATCGSDGEEDEQSTPEDHNTPLPSAMAIQQETALKLHQLIDALPKEAGELIRSAYFEGLTLQEAGKRLGVSKAWASRLHAKTLQRLARALRSSGVAD